MQLRMGQLATGTTKQKELGVRIVRRMLVPVAPAAEQHRLVAVVDSLLSHCERLGALVERRDAATRRFVAAALDGGGQLHAS